MVKRMQVVPMVLVATVLGGCGTQASVFASLDAGSDAGSDRRDAGDGGAPDAGRSDSGPDSGSVELPGCRVEVFEDDGSDPVATLLTYRAPDGRFMRGTLDWQSFETSPDAVVEALSWDAAGRVTHARWSDLTFAVPIVFREEERTFDDAGRRVGLTVTHEDGAQEFIRYLYEDGTLRSVEQRTGGEWTATSTFTLDTENRRVESESAENQTLEWDDTERVVRHTRTIFGGSSPLCRATEVRRDAAGNVMDEREHLCGEPAADVSREWVYEERADVIQLDVLDRTDELGARSERRIWSTDEDRLDYYTARRIGSVDDARTEFAEFHRYTNCGAEVDRTFSSISGFDRASVSDTLFAATPLVQPHAGLTRPPELVPSFRP